MLYDFFFLNLIGGFGFKEIVNVKRKWVIGNVILICMRNVLINCGSGNEILRLF